MLKRCKEELALLLEEMEAYCAFYNNRIRALETEETAIDKCIKGGTQINCSDI